MHKFIDNIVAFSLKNKFFIFFCTAIAVIAGAVSFKHTPIDAFPDVTNTKVTIITQWPGRSAEEVEKFITIPVEIAMNPVQKKTDIRSTWPRRGKKDSCTSARFFTKIGVPLMFFTTMFLNSSKSLIRPIPRTT